MDIINQFYNEINKNSSLFGFALTFITAFFLSIRYLNQKRQELKDKRFETYHKLICDFIGKDQTDMKLDYQIAICYELRRFKKYYPVTLRIIIPFKNDILKNDENNRLVKEILLTIKFIQTNKFRRFFTFRDK